MRESPVHPAKPGTREAAIAAPWHYWAVALICLLWNVIGAYDYTMTQLGGREYFAGLSEAHRAHLSASPPPMIALWALDVWGSFAGSIFLLAKSRFAVPAFWLSLLGLAGNTIYRQLGPMADSFRTPATLGITLVVWAASIFFLWYAIHMRRARVLA